MHCQFDEKMKTSLHNLTQDMEMVKSKSRSVDDSLGKLQNQIGGIDEQMKTHTDDMTKNIDAVKSEMKNNSKSVDDSLEKLQSQFDGTKDQMEKLKDDVFKAKEEVKGVDGQLEVCFKEIKDFSMYIFGVVLTMVVVGAYTYLVSRPKPFNRTLGPVHGTGVQRSSSGEITEKLSRKKIQMGTLIVSFDCTTHEFHHGIFEAISANSFLSVKEEVIQNFGDLMKVEPHKLVIIFVDSNERHIILENPESEIGEFKNQATDVFISLGCDVFVVYCKDKGSQDLSPDNLYIPRLQSVERHPVLRKLKERERVISVNTKFHPHQVSQLESCCNQIYL
ncbi:uncharacterized protein LOC111126901 isoform X5 [Crassostrea virginica]